MKKENSLRARSKSFSSFLQSSLSRRIMFTTLNVSTFATYAGDMQQKICMKLERTKHLRISSRWKLH